MKGIRIVITNLLICAAMKTCVTGDCYDHLVEALKYESGDA